MYGLYSYLSGLTIVPVVKVIELFFSALNTTSIKEVVYPLPSGIFTP